MSWRPRLAEMQRFFHSSLHLRTYGKDRKAAIRAFRARIVTSTVKLGISVARESRFTSSPLACATLALTSATPRCFGCLSPSMATGGSERSLSSART